ncbi:MAG: hypothetical protein KGD58_17640 [Candidatus Lokiarchaeota archaeon]|nr:hypothetical protein [Candidatus Lokiarchaeota archaeon]
MENKKWILICIFGGILMIIGSVVGSITFFETLFSLIEADVGEDVAKIVSLVIQILGYVAIVGGISVIIGALIVAMDHYRIGKLIIFIGAGMGLISFLIFIIGGIAEGTILDEMAGIVDETLHGGYGFFGVLLTIVARLKMKKD